jgi:DNA-binding ferritin-like protein
MNISNIGFTDQERRCTIDLLNHDLADACLLSLKANAFYRSVTAIEFLTLEELHAEHSQILTKHVEAFVERIDFLGGSPVRTMKDFLNLTVLREHPANKPVVNKMIYILATDHEYVAANLSRHITLCSPSFYHQGTADFLIRQIGRHEQIIQKLRSFGHNNNKLNRSADLCKTH